MFSLSTLAVVAAETASIFFSLLYFYFPRRAVFCYHPPQNDYRYRSEIKIENNWPVSDYRRYRFI